MARSLVVKITALGDAWPPPTAELERVAQALTAATTALASGIPTSVWLTGEATRLATPGYAARLTLPHAARFEDLIEMLLAAEVVTVCTQCAARRGLADTDLLPGARIAGAAGFVEQAMTQGAQALVY